jgi:hypothetical protein
MTLDNSYLCPAQRTEVGPEHEPYPADSYWAEPDVEAAGRLLRHVYEQQAEAQARGLRAAHDLKSGHSPGKAGALIRDRLATIRRRRAGKRPAASIALLEHRIEELESENLKLRMSQSH